MKFSHIITTNLFILTLLTSSTLVRAESSKLEEIRQRFEIPGLVAGTFLNGEVFVETAGIRKSGDNTSVASTDKWHLGSNGKSMTATLVAVLDHKGLISFDDNVGKFYDDIHPDYKGVSIRDLLAHRAGLLTLGQSPETAAVWGLLSDSAKVVSEQRADASQYVLTRPADHSKDLFQYSNMGYIIVGNILKTVTGKDWEQLIQEELFEPLEMSSCAFGAAGKGASRPEQPWPHYEAEGKLVALSPDSPYSDNPLSLGPAGCIHCSVQDWAKFMQLHMQAFDGIDTSILPSANFKTLHRDYHGDSYTPGGFLRDDSGGTVRLGHNGSNNLNYAVFVMDMTNQQSFFAAANRAGKGVAGVKLAVEKLGAPSLCLGEACLID